MEILDIISDLHESNPGKDIFDIFLNDSEIFLQTIARCFGALYRDAGLIHDFDDGRALEAYVLWQTDLGRVTSFEQPESRVLDHFKQAAHLTYWLRRLSPVISVQEGELGLAADQSRLRDGLQRYGSQICAFEVGFYLCAYYEANKIGSGIYLEDYSIDQDYREVIGHFFKTKNVSPHAIYLILKSLFFNVLKR